MKPKFTLAAILFVLLTSTIAFAEVTIKAEVDKTSITTDNNITYRLTITSSEKKISEPQLPEFEGFDVVSQMQSSSISFGKGKTQTTLIYIYVLAPRDTGKFEIGPSTVKIGNKTYSTDTFEIEVTPCKARPKTPLEQRPSQPEKIQPESEEPQITL